MGRAETYLSCAHLKIRSITTLCEESERERERERIRAMVRAKDLK